MTMIRVPRRSGPKFPRVTLASALLVIGLLGGVAMHAALATPGGNPTIRACVNNYSGQTRIIPPGWPPNCTASDTVVEWISASEEPPVVPAVEVTQQTIEFTIPAGETVTQDVSCPSDDERAISGGGTSTFVVDFPKLVINQSFPATIHSWRITMTNLDENEDHNAFAKVLCIPAE